MQSYMSIEFIILAIGGLLGQQEFCKDHYCYRTDGKLKNVTSLKDAQDYCYKNDSASWLLEVYGFNQFRSLDSNSFLKKSVLLNSFGTVANNWTSVFNGPLPSGLNIDESLGQDFLYLNFSGGQLYFQGGDKNFPGYFICRVSGNCSDGNCFEILNNLASWFTGEFVCFINLFQADKDYGHLATFDGMTYEEISNLSFVNKLTENTAYWIGYSKLVYTFQHSKVRNYLLPFYDPYPLLTASHPNESYFVYYDSDDNFKEKPLGDAQFQIICMLDNTTLELTTTPTTTTSVVTATTEQTITTVFPTSDTTATTGQTSTPASSTTVSSATATNWNSLETNPTTAGLKTSNETKKSTIILSLLLPILLWLVFSISFICCILPYCVNRNTRREATIP